MRVLFVEKHADGLLDIAIRAQRAGHHVHYWLQDYNQYKTPVGRGLVNRVSDWRDVIARMDLVLLGANDYAMGEFEAWRQRGIPVIGGTRESARWESDRAYGMKMFQRAGIPVPPFKEFTDYNAAIEHVKKQDRAFASKPSGHCDDKSLSYVSREPEHLIYKLDQWKRSGKRSGLNFILQEKVSGIEMAVGAWFGPGGFAPGLELNWEHKKLMAGNLGPNCGEMGTVLCYVARDRLFDKVLKPLETLLHKIRYVGNVDVNTIISDDGSVHPLEFTMRCGWPALNIEMALFRVDFCEFLAGLAAGKPPKDAHWLDEPAVGVVLAHADFPFSHATKKEVVGVPIYDIDEADDDLHFAQVMLGEAPHPPDYGNARCLVSAGDYLMIATGTGSTVQEARRRAYQAVHRPQMPSEPFYRPDIAERLVRQLPELHRLGFATGVQYSEDKKAAAD